MRKVLQQALVAFAATGLGVSAQEKTAAPARPTAAAAATPPTVRAEDERAIKLLVDAFTKAFDAGDAAAVAATYTEAAIAVDERGERTEGREAIRELYVGAFADRPGGKIAIRSDALRFLGPETAIEEGRSTITPAVADGTPDITRYTVVYVKQEGRWLQSVVRDEASKDITTHERLKDLEWLVGDWINESQEAVVATTCKWTDDGNFLVRSFTVKTQGQPVLSGTQRIGWDPVRGQFKTWIFDSEGGFGEGYWTRDGDRWTIKVQGVRQDGKHASATNIITRLSKDRASWQSVDRTLGGTTLPGVDEFTVVRKPPEPGK